MFKKLHTPTALLATAMLLAACAEGATNFGGVSGGSSLTTSAIAEPPKTDPACTTLASQIDGLKKEGVADKVAQASIKKYTMKPADLVKADQLNKANAEFQAKCSLVKPITQAEAPAVPPAAVAAVAPAATAAVKKVVPAAGIAPAVAKAAAVAQ